MTPVLLPLDPAPDPLDALTRVAHLSHPVLLDSAADRDGMGRWSYLAVDPEELLETSADHWPAVRDRIRASLDPADHHPGGPPFQGGWIGWLSYELGRAFDHQPLSVGEPVVPDLSLGLYRTVVAWDHAERRAWVVAADEEAAERLVSTMRQATGDKRPPGEGMPPVACRRSPVTDFTPSSYRAAVADVIARILAGEIFQANLTQQFRMSFDGEPLAAYLALRARAPGSHSAYLDRGMVRVLSMSPELFLRFDPRTRRVETHPIKGTRPRSSDPGLDGALAADLLVSEKDRAENVMIVDLLRNDLSRVAVPGSVAVPSLCRLESFAVVHHLVSTVTATVHEGRDALDLLAAAFPAGSITGAPKLRAMAIIAELEPRRRGVYCGSIGWIGLDGGMELSVAIRTVTLAGGEAMVPAGGGVTALSDPAEEYQETLDKANALLAAIEATG